MTDPQWTTWHRGADTLSLRPLPGNAWSDRTGRLWDADALAADGWAREVQPTSNSAVGEGE